MRLLLLLSTAIAATALPLYAQVTNTRLSNPDNLPDEVTIALNPNNPLNFVVGANLHYYYYTKDGGLTWYEGKLNSVYGVYGDPCLLFDPAGMLYYAHLSNPATGYWIDRIVVQRSSDGGASWDDGVGVGRNPQKQQDKEWLAFDATNSQYRNSLYMSWTEFDEYSSYNPADRSRILFSRSSNRGASWSAPITISDQEGDCLDGDSTVEGAVPAVGPNGEIYVAWSAFDTIYFDRSTDGGKTFGVDRPVATQPGGWDFPVSGLQRCNGLPVAVCDVSNSPYRGTIYILFSDQRNGPENTDVFLIRSNDGGETWSQPVRVNDDDSQRHQFFPAISIDPATGYLYVAFYDRRATTGDVTEVWLARSTDGGTTFINRRISQEPFTPRFTIFLGDYIGVTAYEGRIHAVWTRIDPGTKSTWLATTTDSLFGTSLSSATLPLPAYQFGLITPDAGRTPEGMERIYFSLPEPMPVQILVYNYLGEQVCRLTHTDYSPGIHSVLWDWNDGSGNRVATGLYFIVMATPKGTFNRSLMVQ